MKMSRSGQQRSNHRKTDAGKHSLDGSPHVKPRKLEFCDGRYQIASWAPRFVHYTAAPIITEYGEGDGAGEQNFITRCRGKLRLGGWTQTFG